VTQTQNPFDRPQLERQLAAEKGRAQIILGAIADGVVSLDARGIVDYLNPAAQRITGWTAAEAIGQPVAEVLPLIGVRDPPSDQEPAALSAWFRSAAESGVSLRVRDGGERALQLTVSSIIDDQGRLQGLVLTFRDTSQTTTLIRELAYRASHDALTGLTNREEFERRLKRLVADAQAGGGPHAICYLDLDQFKLVNDTCGHAAGDALLKDVATTLQALMSDKDTLARLGGDEFGLLLPQFATGQAARFAQDVVLALGRLRFEWSERQFGIGGSIGVAPIGRDSGTLDDVLMAVDAACYVAKERGRNRVHVFEPADADVARRQGQMRWVPRLQTALEVGDFQLMVQDIVPVPSGIITGRHLEVLICLPDASGRLIPPGEFLPAAQRYGLMGRIDRWVTGQVCEWLHWRAGTHRVLPELVAINLSGSSLSDAEFRDLAEEQVRSLPAGANLCFEITESEAIANLDEASEFISRMKTHGCRFALDDFGSGLSSFAYLKRLPVDYVKIDGQFVRDVARDPISLAMVESIHRIGKVMGMQTIAEFVETEAIWQHVRSIGVDFCQGYYFGPTRPLLSLA
jgi:Amt family ammonium transporter